MIRYRFTLLSLVLSLCLLSACSLLSAPEPAQIQLTLPPTVVREIVLLPTDVMVSAEIPPSPTAAPTEAVAQVAATVTLVPTLAATETATPLPTLTATPLPTATPTATVEPATETPEPTTAPTDGPTLPPPTEAATSIAATATTLPEPTVTAIPEEPTPIPTDVPTIEQVEATPENTPIPPTLIPDAANEQPIIVSFEPGAISSRLEDQLPIGGARTYNVRALEGQQLFIFLDATNDTPNFSLSGLTDGMPYKTLSNEDRQHVQMLPLTQDYRIHVRAIAETFFWLDIVILPPGVVMPTSAQEIIPWLATMRQSGFAKADLEKMLQSTRQMIDFYAPIGLDSGTEDVANGVWFAPVLDRGTDNFANSGDMGIIAADGTLLFQYSATFGSDNFASAPKLYYPIDLTGDGRIDPLLESTSCGAHTCYQTYDVLTEDGNGGFRPISPIFTEANPLRPISNSNAELTFDPTGTPPILALYGGSVNSAGAGPYQRLWTDRWQYDAGLGQMVLLETILDGSGYRFHLLHDANTRWDDGDRVGAANLYLNVIQNDILTDGVGVHLFEENTHDSTKQFAAFRLMLAAILQNDLAAAQSWRDWLSSGEFNTVSQIPAGAAAFWQSYETDNPGDVVIACNAAVGVLNSAEYPVGAVGYLGYQLPSLGAEDVCPILQ